MRKIATVATLTLALSGFGMTASADSTEQEKPVEEPVSFIEVMLERHEAETLLAKQQAEFFAAQARLAEMDSRIQSLEKHVGNTWYVFSGITPDGWDCSGMVMWFYSKFEIELQHSVTAQMHSGEIVKEPLPGDIIAFKYKGAERGYHNGIYIGNDQFIHSPKPGESTKVSSVSEYIGDHSKAVYTRIDIGVLE